MDDFNTNTYTDEFGGEYTINTSRKYSPGFGAMDIFASVIGFSILGMTFLKWLNIKIYYPIGSYKIGFSLRKILFTEELGDTLSAMKVVFILLCLITFASVILRFISGSKGSILYKVSAIFGIIAGIMAIALTALFFINLEDMSDKVDMIMNMVTMFGSMLGDFVKQLLDTASSYTDLKIGTSVWPWFTVIMGVVEIALNVVLLLSAGGSKTTSSYDFSNDMDGFIM